MIPILSRVFFNLFISFSKHACPCPCPLLARRRIKSQRFCLCHKNMSRHAKAAALREKATSCAEKFQARPIYLRDPTTYANIDIRLLDLLSRTHYLCYRYPDSRACPRIKHQAS
jgi:hypothetical protein